MIRNNHIRIAVVEDDKFYSRLIEYVLKKHYSQVDVFNNGNDIIESEINYDLVILDYDLGDINGVSVAKRLKQRSDGIKVIMLTAFKEIKSIVDFLKIEIEKLIVKGKYALDKLIELVNRISKELYNLINEKLTKYVKRNFSIAFIIYLSIASLGYFIIEFM